ncbi:MAG: alpha/beta hydrolase [Oscillospiraceae bacterium]|nr:alpha/beta hydrolase [Oscillospiraceae bacterium]
MEKLFSVNAEKHSIRCKLYCDTPKDVETVIVFGHGFGGHMGNKAAERFAGRVLEKNKHIAAVTFNWPCHGEDIKKKLTLDDCSAYLRLVLAHVRERWEVQNLYGYATSFGGYLFLRYIAEEGNPFRKLALRCPAVNMYGVVVSALLSEDGLEKLEKGKNVSVGFDRKIEISPGFLEELRRSDIRDKDYLEYADDILILHGAKDEIIPIDEVRRFADDNLIEFVPVEAADHRFTDPKIMGDANARIIAFLGLR